MKRRKGARRSKAQTNFAALKNSLLLTGEIKKSPSVQICTYLSRRVGGFVTFFDIDTRDLDSRLAMTCFFNEIVGGPRTG